MISTAHSHGGDEVCNKSDKEKLKVAHKIEASTEQGVIEPSKPIRYFVRCPCGGPIHIMNGLFEGVEYEPTSLEELANVVTHLIPAILSFFVLSSMLSSVANTHRETIAAYVYGGCCILLFSISTGYHASGLLFGKSSQLNKLFQKADHTIIFSFIAASYTPWCILVEAGTSNVVGKTVVALIWLFAIYGTYSVFMPRENKSSVYLYLLMGWVSVIYISILVYMIASGRMITELAYYKSIIEIMAGGVLYSAGTFIFKLDGRLPFAHSIWHIFVASAAALHMHAVYIYAMALE